MWSTLLVVTLNSTTAINCSVVFKNLNIEGLYDPNMQLLDILVSPKDLETKRLIQIFEHHCGIVIYSHQKLETPARVWMWFAPKCLCARGLETSVAVVR